MNLLTTKGIVQLYSSPLVKYKKQSVILLSELGYMATTIKKDRDVNNVFFHFYTDTSDARLPKLSVGDRTIYLINIYHIDTSAFVKRSIIYSVVEINV